MLRMISGDDRDEFVFCLTLLNSALAHLTVPVVLSCGVSDPFKFGSGDADLCNKSSWKQMTS